MSDIRLKNLPENMKERLQEEAYAQRRSLTQHIIVILSKHLYDRMAGDEGKVGIPTLDRQDGQENGQ